ncbi:TetR/AcrR family transcriptional regulator [Jeotgalibacillus salarius]|uniref:TetR/AcrR family transcriptional regulator n=1 Tax=Jeotgalibacillus salarius TaxID=546023 RepID=A0A4Y8LD78_9BACL|nr:TetR/AcrR family transcriptional regulator [Jeotgalibacillus salarius]TFD99442.1 TetR/AcrR family transcriptional regulator [Jeotgalibacillus salarius]
MSKKKQDLLECADALFYENGFHGVGLKRVVSEAGVALMTLYNHFDSKEDLILEVLSAREKRYFSFLNPAVEEGNTNDKTSFALGLGQSHIKWLGTESTNGCMFLRAKEEYAFENEEIVNQAIGHKKSIISFLQKHGFAQKEATQLALLFEGATSFAEVVGLEAAADELYNLIKKAF